MRDSICFFKAVREHTIELSFWVEEIIVWIDDDDSCVGRHDELKFGEELVWWKIEVGGLEDCFISLSLAYREYDASFPI